MSFQTTRTGYRGRWNRPELQRFCWTGYRSLRSILTIRSADCGGESGFRGLTEAIDTTRPAGRMMTQMIGSFAEFDPAMLRERTRAGLKSARDEGAAAD
jgi:hypothetical protein